MISKKFDSIIREIIKQQLQNLNTIKDRDGYYKIQAKDNNAKITILLKYIDKTYQLAFDKAREIIQDNLYNISQRIVDQIVRLPQFKNNKDSIKDVLSNGLAQSRQNILDQIGKVITSQILNKTKDVVSNIDMSQFIQNRTQEQEK